MCLVRHSLMLVGPPGVGKSKVVEVLQDAVSAAPASENQPPLIGQPHRETRMNPKAITAPQESRGSSCALMALMALIATDCLDGTGWTGWTDCTELRAGAAAHHAH
jgi:hypothetical protein